MWVICIVLGLPKSTPMKVWNPNHTFMRFGAVASHSQQFDLRCFTVVSTSISQSDVVHSCRPIDITNLQTGSQTTTSEHVQHEHVTTAL